MSSKVNLLWDAPQDVRNGYLNLDSFTPEECEDGRIYSEPHDLSAHVDKAEVQEFVAMGILQHLPASMVDVCLERWLSYLAHGGKITVDCTDTYEIARSLWNGSLSPKKANAMIYGDQSKKSRYNCFGTNLEELCRFMESRGYEIEKRFVRNFMCVVVARRP